MNWNIIYRYFGYYIFCMENLISLSEAFVYTDITKLINNIGITIDKAIIKVKVLIEQNISTVKYFISLSIYQLVV